MTRKKSFLTWHFFSACDTNKGNEADLMIIQVSLYYFWYYLVHTVFIFKSKLQYSYIIYMAVRLTTCPPRFLDFATCLYTSQLILFSGSPRSCRSYLLRRRCTWQSQIIVDSFCSLCIVAIKHKLFSMSGGFHGFQLLLCFTFIS